MVKIAAVQQSPVTHDLAATLAKGAQIIETASKAGADLVAFPEAWFSGYPDFAWDLTPGRDDDLLSAAYARYSESAVDLSSKALAPIQQVAADTGTVVVAGITELGTGQASGTLFNAAVIVDADGGIAHVHRKTMPTMAERMVWGFGDASTIKVVETAVGRIGVLLCWECYMPLARAALWAQSPEIFVAPTADPSDAWIATMQHCGKEGGVWVVGIDTPMKSSDYPDDLPARDRIAAADGEWRRPGSAVICDPFGGIAAGPMRHELGLLMTDADLSAIAQARRFFDCTGHYARPDLFTLTVDTSKKRSVNFSNGG